MGAVAEGILRLSPSLALLLVFAVPALEASAFAGFLFPGEIAALLGGVLAFEHRIPLAAAMTAAIAGAVVGDSVGYAVGARFGQRLLLRLPRRLVKPEHIERASSVVNRLGGRAVFVGRFTAALRVLVPGICGMARMPYRTFLLWNVVGGVLWAGGSVLLGFLAGHSWRTLHHRFSQGSVALLGVVVVAAAVGVLLRRRRGRRARPGPSAEPARAEAGEPVER